MLWAALLRRTANGAPPSPEAIEAVAMWAGQFSPRIAAVDEAVLMEVEASLRLFGGRSKLRDRVTEHAGELGVDVVAWAPTGLAALACARAGVDDGCTSPESSLDALPMAVLSAVRPHHVTLAQLGCKTLGDVRQLPRGGIARRFDRELLSAIDQAYGVKPEGYAWITPPERFAARLELMARVDVAPALLFGARRLLLQLTGWLAARHAGATAITLHWAHDSMRSRDAGAGGQITIRTAEATRNLEHLCRLLAENLAKTQLLAAVGELRLEADEVVALDERSASFLPDAAAETESLGLVLERVAARLGPARVLRPRLAEDHRPEWAQHWSPAAAKPPRRRARGPRMPQPTMLFEPPLQLHTSEDRPLYQGPLQLLVGPHRIEGGWWDRAVDGDRQVSRNVQRDYWVARSEHAGLLWIYQARLADDDRPWFLHGTFA